MPNQKEKELSYEYIRGLIDGEGCFTFSTSTHKSANGIVTKNKIPAFSISMHERDEELLNKVKRTLGLRNKIYNYRSSNSDHRIRGRKAYLIVRDFSQLKDIIVPLFYKSLKGHKGLQFEDWIKKIGTDPDVPKLFKLIHRMYRSGFYDKNLKYY